MELSAWGWGMAGLRNTADLTTAAETKIGPNFVAEVENYNYLS